MNFDVLKPAQKLITDNSAAILTGVGIVGTVTTAVLTAKATIKAVHVTEELANQDISAGPVTKKEIVLAVAPLYAPAVGSGITTVTAIFFSYQIASKQSAAFAAAYGISEKAFQEYKDKVVEKMGSKKETTIVESLAQDKVDANPLNDREVIVIGAGDVLCFEELTGRYFRSTIEAIKGAENKINHEVLNSGYSSLGAFYDELGLPATALGDQLGWNMDNLLDVTYSATFAADGVPCISIGFKADPIPDYHRPLHS
ncbi:MAG TPA: DUF6353 family protein [Nitrospira sp.]|nr:DUF6353 family protein [Nitrospira sp.]